MVSDTRGGAGVCHFRALHPGQAFGTTPANVCHVHPHRAQTWRTTSACGGGGASVSICAAAARSARLAA
ncbi:MAG: hypothetical protein IJI36_11945 [Kiritimatiellae bacterium]|nr:hypothetical protein [Kiritimatiellia bacterium]